MPKINHTIPSIDQSDDDYELEAYDSEDLSDCDFMQTIEHECAIAFD